MGGSSISTLTMLRRPLRGRHAHSHTGTGPGAILAVYTDHWFATSHSEDALNTLHYVAYVQKHARSWHEFASRKLGLELEDLIFVTGVDRASTWATAVHDGKRITAIDCGPKAPYPDDNARMEVEAFWKEYFQALLDRVNERPGKDRKYYDEKADRIDRLYREHEGRILGSGYEQSIFLRYVRAKRRNRQATKPETHPDADSSTEYLLEKSEHAPGVQNVDVSAGRELVSERVAAVARPVG